MQPKIVSPREWVEARKQFLIKEKEFTRLRDELSRERRELPWERVDKNYVFDGSNGKVKLADLFDGRNQLVVYHFMFGPDWAEGCPSCSFEADHFNSFIKFAFFCFTCSSVHCFGALSGLQRNSLVPWRKRSPVKWS